MPYKDPEKQKAHKRLLYEQNTQELRKLKDVPCHDCGGKFPHYIMEFDHVRGEKLFVIATKMSGSIRRQAVADEIAKCDVVCANCHAERTFQRGQLSRRRSLVGQRLS